MVVKHKLACEQQCNGQTNSRPLSPPHVPSAPAVQTVPPSTQHKKFYSVRGHKGYSGQQLGLPAHRPQNPPLPAPQQPVYNILPAHRRERPLLPAPPEEEVYHALPTSYTERAASACSHPNEDYKPCGRQCEHTSTTNGNFLPNCKSQNCDYSCGCSFGYGRLDGVCVKLETCPSKKARRFFIKLKLIDRGHLRNSPIFLET